MINVKGGGGREKVYTAECREGEKEENTEWSMGDRGVIQLGTGR